MSRSRRKNKIRGITTATSEKQSKLKANRKLRRLTREVLKKGKEVLHLLREISNQWNFEKDGKKYDSKLYKKNSLENGKGTLIFHLQINPYCSPLYCGY